MCAASLVAFAAVGCVGSAEEPDVVSGSDPTASAESTSSDESTAGPKARVAVYFVDSDVVIPATREVSAGDLDAVVAALFAGPTEGDRGALGAELTTEIPADAEVTAITRDGGRITIDVTEPFIADGGALGIRLRLAQLTYTLTALQDVDEVLLESDGETVRIVGDGLEIKNPLERAQYTGVSPEVLIESPLPGDEIAGLVTASGTTAVPGTEFILRLTDSGGTVVTERLAQGDAESGLFGVEIEYEGAQAGLGTLYALTLEEDLLMGVSVDLR